MIIAVVSRRSNAGKTLFLEKVSRLLSETGCRVPVVKHVHHGRVSINEGKDAERIYLSGAPLSAAYGGRDTIILVRDLPLERLIELVKQLTGSPVVLAEGFKGQAIADFYIYIASGPDDDCGAVNEERLLLSTSLERGAARCGRYMPFEEAARWLASYIAGIACRSS
ncbi:MAG: molybdopterin-guanine dinucleotide biosynthesis protein MobB [Desulfurococcales archaeon]|nr:molybdopterin-guanine dinucleotide biosynthesis protein MobB [Desulfurococcales archaeon]